MNSKFTKLPFIKSVVIALTLIAGGCIDVEFDNLYNGEDQYKDEADVELAVIGAYSLLTKSTHVQAITAYSDYCFNTKFTQPGVVGQNMHSSATVTTQGAWSNSYSTINRSNEIIKYAPEASYENAEKYEQHLAEAHFLRAKAYYDLVRLFGVDDNTQLPYHIKPTEILEDAYADTKSVADIYELIIEDLQYAAGTTADKENRLPLRKESSSEIGRASKGAAEALLASVYLTRKEWNKAIEYANSVINSGQYSLVNYKKLFNIDYEREAYNEVIFGVQHIANANNKSLGSEYAHLFCPPGVNADGSALTGKNNQGTEGAGYGEIAFQNWFVRFFEEDEGGLGYTSASDEYGNPVTGADEFLFYKDYRIESTFFRYYMTGSTVTPKDLKTSYPHPDALVAGAHPYLRKYIDPKGVDKACNGNDYFTIRFAEMYLILAEAYNEIGDYDKATKAIDVIRARARMADGEKTRDWPKDLNPNSDKFLGRTLSQDEFRWAIFMERGLEFAGEGKRFYDMKRMEYSGMNMYDYMKDVYLPQVPTENINKIKCVLADRKKYFPIPHNEIQRNTNPNLVQNKGY